jgi:multidrug efflux pump subunit AcrA (membrane-fusion protein)
MIQMQLRTLFLVLVLILFGVFVVLNWGAFIEPTTLSLGFGEVIAPLGVIMLLLLTLLLLLFLAYVVYLRTTAKLDVDRYTKEMQSQRELINQDETARFTELREFFGGELRKIADRDNQIRKDLLAKLDKVDRDLRKALRQQEVDEAFNEREEYKQKLQAQLDEWKIKIAELKGKAVEAEAGVKADIEQQVNELEGKVVEAEAKLAELADAGEDTWETVKKRVEHSWDSLRNTIGDAASKLKD